MNHDIFIFGNEQGNFLFFMYFEELTHHLILL